MILADVNILIYAARADARDHDRYLAWLRDVVEGDQGFAYAEPLLASFIRICTNPRAFTDPTPLDDAFMFTEVIRTLSNAVKLEPGARHWEIFRGMCEAAGASGNLIPDAYLAALAVEHGCELISTDRDFGRFPGLRWRTPF